MTNFQILCYFKLYIIYTSYIYIYTHVENKKNIKQHANNEKMLVKTWRPILKHYLKTA